MKSSLKLFLTEKSSSKTSKRKRKVFKGSKERKTISAVSK
jgi:hypothetical protein